MEKLVIIATIRDVEVTKKHNLAVPYTVEEMVRKARSTFKASVAVIHIHVRENDDAPTQGHERFYMMLNAIKEACPGVILIPSTGNAVSMTAERRLQPIELFPEMATLDCSTYNFGNDIFTNDVSIIRASGKRMVESHIRPEYECFETGHPDIVVSMANKGEIPGAPMQLNFVLGVSGCTPATVDSLDYLVRQIPAGSTWTVAGAGRGAWPMMATGTVMDGNTRVGFEDNIYLEGNHKAAFNGELVEEVIRLAKELGRGIATSDEAREILSLT